MAKALSRAEMKQIMAGNSESCTSGWRCCIDEFPGQCTMCVTGGSQTCPTNSHIDCCTAGC